MYPEVHFSMKFILIHFHEDFYLNVALSRGSAVVYILVLIYYFVVRFQLPLWWCIPYHMPMRTKWMNLCCLILLHRIYLNVVSGWLFLLIVFYLGVIPVGILPWFHKLFNDIGHKTNYSLLIHNAYESSGSRSVYLEYLWFTGIPSHVTCPWFKLQWFILFGRVYIGSYGQPEPVYLSLHQFI